MLAVPESKLLERLRIDNPWWSSPEAVGADAIAGYPRRDYYASFARLVRLETVRRAVILLGPRRVGKTVMVGQLIRDLLREGEDGRHLLYLSLDTPIYTGLSLEGVLSLFRRTHGHAPDARMFVFFDEVQYHADWERHLKSLVDAYPRTRFVATGSAAATIRRRSEESGAGRFTDFILPPLTFAEYLHFVQREQELVRVERDEYTPLDLPALNAELVNYVNFGGYPEAVLSADVRRDHARFVGNDIVQKVLLNDLPSLYGISNIQELNRLFAALAFNTGGEVSLEALTQDSGVSKPTVMRYVEYLEAAFLLRRLRRVDDRGAHFQREHQFKVYLTNPSMRGALYGSVEPESPVMGPVVETAVFSQCWHAPWAHTLRYARWKKGEVDLVSLSPLLQQPTYAVEVKWSDRVVNNPDDWKGLVRFARQHNLPEVIVTTRTHTGAVSVGEVQLQFIPAALYVYVIGALATQPLLEGIPETLRALMRAATSEQR